MLFLGWLALFFPIVAFAQEKIEAPAWNVGDKWDFGQEGFLEVVGVDKNDDLVKSLLERHPGESRGPEPLEITGFRLSPE